VSEGIGKRKEKREKRAASGIQRLFPEITNAIINSLNLFYVLNQQSPINNPQSSIQTIPNQQSTINNPNNPQSTINNQQSKQS
jgi:hypothetical protein